MLTLSGVTFDRSRTPQLTVTFPHTFDGMAGRAVDVARGPIVQALMREDGARPADRHDYEEGTVLRATAHDGNPLRFTVRAV